MTVYTLGVIKITLSGRVSEINAFLCFTQKFKMVTKMVGKKFWTKLPDDFVDTQVLKNFVKFTVSCMVYEILKIF